jgi:hypothetical protein
LGNFVGKYADVRPTFICIRTSDYAFIFFGICEKEVQNKFDFLLFISYPQLMCTCAKYYTWCVIYISGRHKIIYCQVYAVTKDAVSIGKWIIIFLNTNRCNFTNHYHPRLMISVTVFTALLGSGPQLRTLPLLCVSELSPTPDTTTTTDSLSRLVLFNTSLYGPHSKHSS